MNFNNFKKLLDLFSLNKSSNFFFIVVCSFVAMLMEIVSIALIIPLVLYMGDETRFFSGYFGELISTNLLNKGQVIIAILILLIIAFLSKNLFLLYLYYKQSRFSYQLQEAISNKIFENNILLPYANFIYLDSSELLRSLTYDVAQFTNSISVPFLGLLSESILILGIFLFLLVIYPVPTLITGVSFLIFGLLFRKMTKERLVKWGRQRQSYEEKIISHVNKINNGIREVKVYNLELMSISAHKELTRKISEIGSIQSVINSSSRLWIEQLAVSLLVLSLIFSETTSTLAHAMPVIVMFSIAAFRILPSLTRIISNLNYLKYSIAIIESLHLMVFNSVPNNTIKLRADERKKISFISLELVNLSFKYHNSDNNLISNLNLRINAHDFLVVVGKSGSGKTTLISLICGLLKPSSGSIRLNGRKVNDYSSYVANLISYVPQDAFIFNDTIKQNITYGLIGPIDEIKLNKAIFDSGLEEFVNAQKLGANTFIGENGKILSGGQKQRLSIARALYRKSQILILDESTSSLDHETKVDIFETLTKLTKEITIIFITHDKFIINQSESVINLDTIL
jgi:ABC-type multidrug transport system fused ATPase/permease subunit